MTDSSANKFAPVNVDIKFLTPRELSDIMSNAGLDASDLDNPLGAEDPGQALAAIAWVIRRREFPDLTLDESWDIPISLEDEAEVSPSNASS